MCAKSLQFRQILFNLATSSQFSPNLVKSCRNLQNLAKSCQIYQTSPNLGNAGRILSNPGISCRVSPNLAESGQILANHVISLQILSKRVESRPTLPNVGESYQSCQIASYRCNKSRKMSILSDFAKICQI